MRAIHWHLAAGLLVTGCSGGPIVVDEEPPLPEKPQVLASAPFVVFPVLPAPVTPATGPAMMDAIFVNGGQQDLVFSDISIQGDTAGVFSITSITPTDMTAKSRGSVIVSLQFDPPARGIYLARLATASNAENLPVLDLEIAGPAASNPPSAEPDLLVFETTAHVVENTNQAFVRFANVGSRSLAIAGYDLLDAGTAVGSGGAGGACASKACGDNVGGSGGAGGGCGGGGAGGSGGTGGGGGAGGTGGSGAYAGPFSFPPHAARPTIDAPLGVAGGAAPVVVTVNYDPTGATGVETADFLLTTYDYCCVEYTCGERVVPSQRIVRTPIGLTSEPAP